MRYIDQIDLKDKRVFIRCDFNVPMDKQGNITDDSRIRAHLPTIDYAIKVGSKIIVASHLGRPKGKKVEEFSLKPTAQALSGLLGREVIFVEDCIGDEVEKKVSDMKVGDIVLLENLRFYPGEEKNDAEFAAKLARLCDCLLYTSPSPRDS